MLSWTLSVVTLKAELQPIGWYNNMIQEIQNKCKACLAEKVKGIALAYYLKIMEQENQETGWVNIFQMPENKEEPCPWCRQPKEIKSSLLVAKL